MRRCAWLPGCGGFLARKGDGEPGVKILWLGMQRILDFAAGIRFARQLQAQGLVYNVMPLELFAEVTACF